MDFNGGFFVILVIIVGFNIKSVIFLFFDLFIMRFLKLLGYCRVIVNK